MCLIAFAIRPASRWPLVIAANRDEYFERPTAPLARWQGAAGIAIVSGRDLRAGGCWLGMSDGGRVAMLTNVREAGPVAGQRSRGELAQRWLEGDIDAAAFMRQTDPGAYGGFNLVVGDAGSGQWHWLSNRAFGLDSEGAVSGRAQAEGWRFRALEAGIYGLSNAVLDTPWPKTMALKQALAAALAGADGPAQPLLWQALQARERHALLPDSGLPAELESMLSSAFVDDGRGLYGTRCSTVLVAEAEPDGRHWGVTVGEKTWPARDARAPTAEHRERLRWSRGG